MKTIPISGVIGWDVTAQGIRDALKEANGDAVTFDISSPGGYIGAGLEIFNLIRNYSGETTAKLSGYAMSMAAYIPQACDNVMAEDNAVYMIHMASGGVWGDYKEIQKFGAYLEKLSDISAKQFVKSTTNRGKGKDLAEVKQMMEETTYLFGDEMLDHGFVDSLIETGSGDSETSLLTAQTAYKECEARMASDKERLTADMQHATALMCAMSAAPPAAGRKPVGAVGRGEPGKDAASIVNSKAYPRQVREMAAKVLAGTAPQYSLDALVAAVDTYKGMQTKDDFSVIDSEEKLQALLASTKGGAAISQQQIDAADPTNVTDAASLEAAIQLAKGENVVRAPKRQQIDAADAANVTDEASLQAAIAMAKG